MFFKKYFKKFFKNRVMVTDYLEERMLEMLTDEGIFKKEGFFEEYHTILSNFTSSERVPPTETNGPTVIPADRDLFINRFIGTFLWLIKYRTLTTARNSARKLAFLDLSFDIEIPKIIDRLFNRYDTDTIKESYDSMDLRCKKIITGELQKAALPRFLVSPLWTKNPDPHPFQIAARLFTEDVGHNAIAKDKEAGRGCSFIDEIQKRFIEFTQWITVESADINFLWLTNR